ncbi:MAG TPA: hypothetical protein DD459_14615 [Halieaceae bacterium]|nr:hypothetical protein [Halieaceae bacterium]|tara:strand:+ start:4091 stop:5149 length:1059 start_codon:yes stop_codon:yes gene_type:complete
MTQVRRLPIAARRSFRLAAGVGIALALGYGLGMPLPYIAPLFAVLLGAKPAPPPGPRQLLMLITLVVVTLGLGVLLGPLLQHAPFSALLLITVGLFASSQMALERGQETPATLLALGLTVIPATSALSQALASAVITALAAGIAIAVVAHWIAYPLFPEDHGTPAAAPEPSSAPQARWLSLRATLIVMPAFLLTLTNPALYLPVTVKSILLGREATNTALRTAGRELIGSTALGGVCAVLVWCCLQLAPNLWFFTGWMVLVSLALAAGIYGVLPSRLPPTFWVNTLTTLIILLGAAVQDSAQGNDVFRAFAVRMALFLAVTTYAVLAMSSLEKARRAIAQRRPHSPLRKGVS